MSRSPDSISDVGRKDASSVVIHWIPLGAGGAAAVRVSGRIYEAIRALVERRNPRHLYHAALEIRVEGERFVIENAWPSPDSNTAARGVVLEGPVWNSRLCRFRMFRYEVRCWKNGTIPDAHYAVASPILSDRSDDAHRILEATSTVPRETWGRQTEISNEMWTSNSVISYLLTVSGVTAARCRPPNGGRAPGWDAGICVGRDRAPVRAQLGNE